MKWLLPIVGLALFGFGVRGQQGSDQYVIITGGARGNLAPCGCTKPMTGGLKRMANMVRELKTRYNAIWIDAGDITNAPGRQSELKVEAYAPGHGRTWGRYVCNLPIGAFTGRRNHPVNEVSRQRHPTGSN